MSGFDIVRMEKEVADLKVKREALLAETTKLFNEKIAIIDSIGKYKAEASIQSGLAGKLTSENVELAAKLSTKKAQLKQVESRINQDTQFLDEREKIIKQKEEEFAWTVKKTEEERSAAKEAKRIADLKVQEAARIAMEAEGVKSEAQEALKEAREITLKYQELIAAVKADAQANAKVADQNNALGHQLKAELNEVKITKMNLADQIKHYQSAVTDLNKSTALVMSKQEDLDAEIAKYKRMTDSLGKEAGALQVRDNELKIRQLRIDKIIREKEIAKELAELERQNEK